MRLILPLLVLTVLSTANTYRILGVFPFPGKSHWFMFETVMKELARRGHQVDVVSPFPQKQPIANYTDITVNGEIAFRRPDMTFELLRMMNPVTVVYTLSTFAGNGMCELLLDEPLQSLIHDTPRDTYDIVITEIFSANCYLAFGHHFDVPLVSMIASAMSPWANDPVGNVDNPSYIPNYLLSFTEHMTFWERLVNTVVTDVNKMEFNLFTGAQNKILRDAFGPGLPDLRELEKKIDLLLVNSHYSLNSVRPFTPAVVEVGGLHVRNNSGDVSTELVKYLDEGVSGVVYFSTGTNVMAEIFPPAALASFYASFAKLAPIRVLWKANKEVLPKGLPGNVLTMDWIPQNYVLNHKNVKVFITHGGLLGTQEAILAGVPLVGIPMFGDQGSNVRNYVDKKLAVLVDRNAITEESLDVALNSVLNDPTYRSNAQRISKQFKDRPMSPLDTAVWWIEYIGRNGKGSLRSPAVDLAWWQVALIDVYGVLLLATIFCVYAMQRIVRSLLICGRNYLALRAKKVR